MRYKNEIELYCNKWDKLFQLACLNGKCYTGCCADHDLDMFEQVAWNFVVNNGKPFDCNGCSAFEKDGSCITTME
jgi:hypothetical protein